MDKPAEARRWKREIDLADRREKDYRDEGEKIIKRYRGEERKKGRYNILWSNTEILRPAIYNSPAKPDVRRRFRDADPLGKAVSTVLERCLDLFVDDYGTDCAIKNDVLDSLLPGRGVSRVRYVPSISEAPPKPANPEADVEAEEDDEDAGIDEQLDYERLELEHVDWRDFRHGYGRVWAEVEWIAFRCKLTRKESEDKFGDEAVKGIEFTEQTSDDSKRPHDTVGETQKLAEFWNVWDRVGKREFFTQEDVEELLYPTDNPSGMPSLDLVGFYPIAEPLKLIENTGSLEPIPHFTEYREQAEELDRLSTRITKIVEAIRVRGAYDSKLSELADIVDSGDNQLTPVENGAAWRDVGLDKAITWMPIEPQAKVLTVLYEARDACKRTIDEITGISDIIRGATVASETATAQQIKSNYASIRLQRMVREVQRYIRDTLRIAAEVIANKFQQDTLQKMTELQLPTIEQKQQAMQQAQMTGQPPDPMLMKLPTWDDVMQALRNDALRTFKVDVETDSTVAGSLDQDMKGLSEVMQAITMTLQGLAPLVQAQALPVDAAKEIVLSVARRARMGLAVEDAFDKLQAPQPPAMPQEPPDTAPQVAQIKAQSDQQVAQLKAQSDNAIAQTNAQRDVAIEQNRQEQETMRERERIASGAADAVRQQQHEARAQALEAALEAANLQREQQHEHVQNTIAHMVDMHKTMQASMDKLHSEKTKAEAQPKKPSKRKGSAKLPSGGVLTFEIGDADEPAATH